MSDVLVMAAVIFFVLSYARDLYKARAARKM